MKILDLELIHWEFNLLIITNYFLSLSLTIKVNDPISNTTRSFTFNVVFEPEATQEEIFEHSGVKRLIDMALEG